MTTENVIEVVGLRHKYGRTIAIDDVSLEVRGGEILCVIGPNGAGKTTLLCLLGGMLLPNRGHVTVLGLDRWRDNYEIRKRSTLLLADPAFGSSPTPYEFLRFFAQIYHIPKQTFLERLKQLADQMQIFDHLNKPWEKLSLGMMKKTGLVAAFLPEARLRIMDEPFAGGIDPLGMEQLYAWMQDARERGETIVFSTQVLEQAENVADRIMLLENGAVRAQGSPQAIIEQAGVSHTEPRALYRAFLSLTRETPK